MAKKYSNSPSRVADGPFLDEPWHVHIPDGHRFKK